MARGSKLTAMEQRKKIFVKTYWAEECPGDDGGPSVVIGKRRVTCYEGRNQPPKLYGTLEELRFVREYDGIPIKLRVTIEEV